MVNFTLLGLGATLAIFWAALPARGDDLAHRPEDVLRMAEEIDDVDEWPDGGDEILIRSALELARDKPTPSVFLSHLLGRSLSRQSREREAAAVFKGALQSPKPDPLVELYAAATDGSFAAKSADEQKAFINRLIADASAARTKADLLGSLATVAASTGDLAEASRCVTLGLKQDPGSQKVNALRIGLLCNERRFPEGLREMDRLLREFAHKGGLEEMYDLRGKLAFGARDHGRTVASHQRAMSLRTDAGADVKCGQAFVHIAQAHLATGRLANARLAARWATVTNPQSGFPHYLLARVAAQLNQFDTALASVDTAIGLDPEFPYYRALRADILSGSGKADDAKAGYLDVAKTCTDNSRAMLSWARHVLATSPTAAATRSVVAASERFVAEGTGQADPALWRLLRARAHIVAGDQPAGDRELQHAEARLKTDFPDPNDMLAAKLRADLAAVRTSISAGKAADPVPLDWLYLAQ